LDDKIRGIIEKLARGIVKSRGNPLLILYYSDFIPPGRGRIVRKDIEYLYKVLGEGRKTKIENLDVLLHTYGGEPGAAYLMMKMINDIAKNVTMLVPYYAYSAGTLMCMGTNKIELGPYATLSPIDIHYDTPDGKTIYLINVDSYIEFAKLCRKTCEDDKLKTNVETGLLTELVKQVGALDLGGIFRARTLTAHYADRLLTDHMFSNLPENDREERKNRVISSLIWGIPSHDFEIDYWITKNLGLFVDRMKTPENENAMLLVDELGNATNAGIICRYLGEKLRMPFFKLFK